MAGTATPANQCAYRIDSHQDKFGNPLESGLLTAGISARIVIAQNPATQRRELASFYVEIWLGEPALISKMLDAAVAKYGSPDKHIWEPDRYSKVNKSYWRWIWMPVPSETTVNLTLSITTFGGEHEPKVDETATTVEISATDERVGRAIRAIKAQKLKHAPPPIKF